MTKDDRGNLADTLGTIRLIASGIVSEITDDLTSLDEIKESMQKILAALDRTKRKLDEMQARTASSQCPNCHTELAVTIQLVPIRKGDDLHEHPVDTQQPNHHQ